MANYVTPIQVPLTDGAIRSFGHIRLNVGGLDFDGGFKSIKYSRTRKRDKVMSNSADPVGKTLGENDYKCTAVFLFDWWANFIQQVQNTLGAGYGDQSLTIMVNRVGVGLTVYQDTILGCTIDSTDVSDESGTKELTREIDFGPLKILFNGLDDLETPLVQWVVPG